MTVVVEVGPTTVRGPRSAAPERIAAAIDCMDDTIALLDEQPVEVARLWRDVLAEVATDSPGALALVVPTWWSAARVDVLTEAAGGLTDDVTVLRRAALLGAGATVLELCAELVVVASPGSPPAVLRRVDGHLPGLVGTANAVIIDVAAAVAAPDPDVTAELRNSGVPVSFSDRRSVVDAAEHVCSPPPCTDSAECPTQSRRRPVPALFAGAALALSCAVGVGVAHVPAESSGATAVLVEGRAAVRVPADWTTERLTSGPGSPRVRVTAPGGSAALHLTQSTARGGEPVGDSLRRALAAEPAGVFTDFDPDGHVGGRSAVTYREHRTNGETAWAVVVDGTLRIAIGCQGATAAAPEITGACLDAVLSARAVR